MKKFTVTEIRTLKDGTVVLTGPKGEIRVRRGEAYSSALVNASPREIAPAEKVHAVTVEGLPKTGKNVAF